MRDWIEDLYQDPEMARMGHGQCEANADLGLGWIYYGLARALRPTTVVVIGSFRGFVPLILSKALQDSGSGEVIFIDPSFVDDFWAEPEQVANYFSSRNAGNIRHYRTTIQDFVNLTIYKEINDIGLLFVDGFHSEAQARFDHEAFLPKMAEDGVALFHDSVRERTSRMYGDDKPYTHTVCRYMDSLRSDERFEVLAFPLADGLTIVKKRAGVEVKC